MPLPQPITAGLTELQPPDGEGVRRTAPADMHLTLHFLGHRATAPVVDALASVASPVFTVRLSAAGHFSLRGRKSILWIGVEPTAPLIDLRAAVGAALEASGFEPEARHYVPHITLARLGSRAGRDLVTAFEQQDLPEAVRAFACDRFALYASETAPGGARYRMLESWPLGGAG